jgi:hypothetical protein
MLLPPWVSVAELLLPERLGQRTNNHQDGHPPSFATEPAHAKVPGSTVTDVQSQEHATTLLHFALPGEAAATASSILPIDMHAQAWLENRELEVDGAGGGQEQAGQRSKACEAKQWWSFGSPVAIYDLAQVGPGCVLMAPAV